MISGHKLYGGRKLRYRYSLGTAGNNKFLHLDTQLSNRKTDIVSENIGLLSWPETRPDLNPIENLRHRLKTPLRMSRILKLNEVFLVMNLGRTTKMKSEAVVYFLNFHITSTGRR
ncbi:hypothetical protein TNCV_1499021 [Trichonephila clavipes]|nr:hypothetical protein TNCV_1499021 [Trichonephila clavipes]